MLSDRWVAARSADRTSPLAVIRFGSAYGFRALNLTPIGRHRLALRSTQLDWVYAEAVKVPLLSIIVSALTLAMSTSAQPQSSRASETTASEKNTYDAKHPPKFEDFPIAEKWNQERATVKLSTGSERMFRTQLTNAAKEPPNFAGHYRIAYWGCGSFCSAGALVDLQTGDSFPLPLAKTNGTGWEKWIMCTASFEGTGHEFHIDSRLMLVRCGMNFSVSLKKNVPDVYYFVWERNRFRQLMFVSGKQPER